MIGDVFHLAAVAEFADVIVGAGKAVDNLGAHIGRAFVAAQIDRQILVDGLRAGAAQRRIQQGHAGCCQGVVVALLVLDRQGAAFHHRCRRFRRRGDAAVARHHGVERGAARQRGQYDIGAGGDLAGRAGNSTALAGQLVAARGDDIETGDRVAGFQKVARNRRTHDSQADNANVFTHAEALPLLAALIAYRRRRKAPAAHLCYVAGSPKPAAADRAGRWAICGFYGITGASSVSVSPCRWRPASDRPSTSRCRAPIFAPSSASPMEGSGPGSPLPRSPARQHLSGWAG